MSATVSRAGTPGATGGSSAEPLTYTIDQAAQKLGVNRTTAYQAARTGELP